MTTLIALSDSHTASLTSLPASLREALKKAELIVHAGDATESTFIDELKTYGQVVAVAGNMDSIALKMTLPARQLFTVEGRSIGLTHGSGAPSGIQGRVRALFPENPDMIVYGHSHEAYVGMLDGSLMVNPGPAATSYAVVTIAEEITARIVRL
jgi:putative phosphoesterase